MLSPFEQEALFKFDAQHEFNNILRYAYEEQRRNSLYNSNHSIR